jgi:PRC-barrel domain
MTTMNVWVYRETLWTQNDLTGFSVEALDGSIGKVDEASNDVGVSYLVVDTGPWIFGKKVLLPAGVVRDVDLDTQTVFVNRSKDEIKNAPEFDQDRYRDDAYRQDLSGYYGRGGAGYRDDYL